MDRLRLAYRRKLAVTMQRYGNATSRQPEAIPVLNVGTGGRPPRNESIVAGFYVNWADNSFASLQRNYDKLDWVIGEWGFIPADADYPAPPRQAAGRRSLQQQADRDAPVALPDGEQLRREARASDSATGTFDEDALRRFLTNPAARANAIRQLRTAVTQYGLAGTTIDFENTKDAALHPQILAFAKSVHDAMHSIGRLSTQAIAASDTISTSATLARGERQDLPDALRRALSGGEAGADRQPAVLRARRRDASRASSIRRS